MNSIFAWPLPKLVTVTPDPIKFNPVATGTIGVPPSNTVTPPNPGKLDKSNNWERLVSQV